MTVIGDVLVCDAPSSSSACQQHQVRKPRSGTCTRAATALFYAFSSSCLMVVNKSVLSGRGFPSATCLGVGQLAATALLLYAARRLRVVRFQAPRGASATWRALRPLPLLHVANMLVGFGGTRALSLPMFTALRRLLVVATMLAEYCVLDVRPTRRTQLSVSVMAGGALVAAADDLAFSAGGYAYVALNNAFSAAYAVYIKKKLSDGDDAALGQHGLMFYNAVITLLPTLALAHLTGELRTAFGYAGWSDPWFVLQFAASCVMGFVLTFSVFLCTHHNSALETSMVGCVKNVCITYVGMVYGQDYIFSPVNFIGINISVVGSFIYLFYSQEKRPSGSVQTI